MLDTDGSGSLSLKEAAVLIAWLNDNDDTTDRSHRVCDACDKDITPLLDQGFRCKVCEKDSDSSDSDCSSNGSSCAGQHGGNSFDLCSSCYSNSSCWPKHHHKLKKSLVKGSEVGPYPALPLLLGEMVECDCCGEEHDLVVASYLKPYPEVNLHMQPLFFKNPKTGRCLEGAGQVGMSICS
jgi:hypothetical protein